MPNVKNEWKASFPESTPIITNTTAADKALYRSLAAFAYDSYCKIAVGEKAGTDGTLLWKSGNGINVQYTHISFSPSLGIVVAFEGTNASSLSSITTNLGHHLSPPVPDLEWLGDVHIANSVQASWLLTASLVQKQVIKALSAHPNADLHVTGHSLGAALGLISALALSHELQRSIGAVFFGMPRVGDQKFADKVDELLPRQRHLVKYRDPVPHLPALVFDFRHPSGEVYIADNTGKVMYDCRGQENVRCSFGLHLYEFHNHLLAGYGDPDKKCPKKEKDYGVEPKT